MIGNRRLVGFTQKFTGAFQAFALRRSRFLHKPHPMNDNPHSLADLRREYLQDALRSRDLDANPLAQFNRWLGEARESGIEDPTAMTLSTTGPDDQPTSRIVLLKGADDDGFRFFTNLGSRKSLDIEVNPRVSLHFYWDRLCRQVSVLGRAGRLDRSDSAAYFETRPRDSQLASWASCQGEPVQGRDILEKSFMECAEKFDGGEVPLPPDWGGFLVIPEKYEFWQGRPGRLHDRFIYETDGFGNWGLTRLAP